MGMQQNGDSTDRTARVLTGAVTGVSSLAILAGAVSLPAIASPVLVVVFLILIGTSLTGFCPLSTAGGRYLHRLDPIGLILTTVVIFGHGLYAFVQSVQCQTHRCSVRAV
jgi:hypothetical protein